jgi:extracellular elastinolytic metalloproteinase
MTADPSIAPGNEEPVMVVDWVKDFAPTGGELGAEIRALFGPDREQQLQIPHLQNRPARSSENTFTTQSTASTTDEKEVKRLKTVKPEYKVRPFSPIPLYLTDPRPSLPVLGLALGRERS